jgi:hypothetical protein
MPTLALTHDYPNGSALDATGHADNLYSETPEEGFYSLLNGGLSGVGTGNFAAGFEHGPEHVAPGEMVFLGGEIQRRTLRCLSATITGNDANEPSSIGFGMRIRLAWQPSCLRVSYAFHAAAWRVVAMEQAYAAGSPPEGAIDWQRQDAANMYLDLYFNGVRMDGHRIKMPSTIHVEDLSAGSALSRTVEGNGGILSSYEDVRAHTHAGTFIVPGGTSGATAKKGMNTVEFRAWIDSPRGSSWKGDLYPDQYPMKVRQGAVEQSCKVKFYPRITFGHRTVTALAFGSPPA